MAEKIYPALMSINKCIGAIKKAQKNQQQGFNFRGIDDVMNELHKLFADNGVVILQDVESINQETFQTARGGNMYRTIMQIAFHFIAEDGSKVTIRNIGEAMDTADKGANKAMSIALKYALMQMFLIPTAEQKDPDAVTPESTYNHKPVMFDNVEDAVKGAIARVEKAKTRDEVLAIWREFDILHTEQEFVDACKQRTESLKK